MVLNKCPVCRNSDFHRYQEGLARKDELEAWFIEDPEYVIECNICGHMARGYNWADVEETWNKGVAPTWEYNWWKEQEKQNENGN